ncbi:hypothetical protein JTE90_028155 [Oedothorax gibbosus]|uniref:Large ribosomal subunit protein mL53 n=1 Tax=Oedothorax gibbosus TaxID=931172 RepID=A0AAV6VAD1_9ARAC|nr:hypothetical protein JTE90_028155 [Oedothorax gibbosus]
MAYLKNLSNPALRPFYQEVKKFHLRPIKKLSFQFDPFHKNAKCVRDFMFHISSKKIRQSNEVCAFKTEIVNDRSDPTISLDLSNGLNVLFKCAHLSSLEVAKEFNKIIEKYDIKEEEPTFKLKSTLQRRK